MPTAEAHHITFIEDGKLPAGTLKADGTFDSGAGTANAGFTTLIDHDAGFDFSVRSHGRLSGLSDDATVKQSGHTVTVDYTARAGSQNNDAGTDSTRGNASLDFQISKMNLADAADNAKGSKDDFSTFVQFRSSNADGTQKVITGYLMNTDDTHFEFRSTGDGGVKKDTVLISGFNPAGDHISNSTNAGFGVFSGKADVPVGDYHLSFWAVDNTGIDAGREIARLDVNLHLTDPLQAQSAIAPHVDFA
ncbi:hypothetical protein AEGHOMDF_2930 [Methylobacterium soli]|nr:hypothetical protein AEGHOMDF_2930 [Methylobacterium soli]